MSQHDHCFGVTQIKDSKSNINIPYVALMQIQNNAQLHHLIIPQFDMQKHKIVIKK